jgi:hypothetical protein
MNLSNVSNTIVAKNYFTFESKVVNVVVSTGDVLITFQLVFTFKIYRYFYLKSAF